MGTSRWWNGFGTRPDPPASAPPHSPEELVAEALRARSRPGLFEDRVAELAADAHALRALMTRLRNAVTTAWERGWQPVDLARFTSRRLGPRHERLAADVIAAEMRSYAPAGVDARWRDQLAAIEARIWWDGDHTRAWCEAEDATPEVLAACAVEILDLLLTLPRLAMIGPRPGTTGARSPAPGADDVDQRMLGKVRALLSKAESTEFPEEAEALSTRAQELMARHSIDHALLDAESGTGTEPAGRRLAVDTPYDGPKAALLTVVADANRCRAVWHRELGFSTVLGFPADLAAVEMMFTSLLVQATTAMVHAGPHRDAAGRSRTRSFRHAFLNAYAHRIGERLRETTLRVTAETGGQDLLPVLAARGQAVDDVVETLFPHLIKGRARPVSNHEGWAAGRAAAELASLSARPEVSSR
ncbi:DUF2786 domain-containing protein [Actinomadura viridis]|uniref:DUF2786 domain-containing protein n=1 Tax=Actinomadura viridis TaxID=58110 RepID=A0A931DLS8_9ACTN|nr:DUF2786 domain-containing protein [Actinomadura viridis]MBG6088973.1 hypothetical protein [Actinomadura viridis]